MAQKNIYMVQPTYKNGACVYFPYAIGALVSYAWKFADIADNYVLRRSFILREDPDAVLEKTESPFLVGFSCYMWNMEYNKVLARKIKERYPRCVIVFGGQQIPDGTEVLEACPYVDILIHREGEVPFRDLLRALLHNTPLSAVHNISYRTADTAVQSVQVLHEAFDFPSPYASGYFERLMREYPDLTFIPLIETNRGCPNRCTYCSWGIAKAGVRMFPLEQVFADLEWVSRHQMEFLGFADANFGMFPRDEQIVDKIIELHRLYGYPKKFQVSYAKDSDERVFRITKRLNDHHMDKGVTLSFQSMSAAVQENIGRSNMDLQRYKSLLRRYAQAGIPTYSDLILGLPGETYDSFRDGIEELLECGQHTSLFVHLCEWLPCAQMGQAAYMEKYHIRITRVPINQPHRSRDASDTIPEYSNLVTSTFSMTQQDWKRMNLFASCVLCFHHLGLLQLFALYLHREKGVRYASFYDALLRFMLRQTGTLSVFRNIEKRLEDVLKNSAQVVIFDERFGNVAWPFEEYAFLSLMYEKQAFYQAVTAFLRPYFSDESLFEDLLEYQKFILKTVGVREKTFAGRYDWKAYFEALLSNRYTPLEKRDVRYAVRDDAAVDTWAQYAQKVLWYGRRGGKNVYTAEIRDETGGDAP